MHAFKRLLLRYKPYFGKLYHGLKRVAKKIDKVVVRVISFGRYFRPHRVKIDLTQDSLADQVIYLRAEDTKAFTEYNKSTSPTLPLRVYSKLKHYLRALLARVRSHLKEAVT